MRNECQQILSQLDDMKKQRNEIKHELDQSALDDSEEEPLTLEQMKKIEKRLDGMKDKLKNLEETFNRQS
jgi:hypothetical protein